MEQRVIPLQIVNEYITGAGVTIGAVGSHDEVLLEMDFRQSPLWVGTTRRAIFTNALGQQQTPIILTTDLLAEGQVEVYLVPVPQEAKNAAGVCYLTVEGIVVDQSGNESIRCVTEEAEFRVLPSKFYVNDDDPVTPSQAEQLQAEIDSIKETIVDARAAANEAEEAKENAITSATEAAASADAAQEEAEAAELAARQSAEYAQNSETAADRGAQVTEQNAQEAEAWAVGKRGGVDVGEGDPAYQNNAKYYKEETQKISVGDVPTKDEARGYAQTAEDNAKEYADLVASEAEQAASDYADEKKVSKSGDTMTGSLVLDKGDTGYVGVSTYRTATNGKRYRSDYGNTASGSAQMALYEMTDESTATRLGNLVIQPSGVLRHENVVDGTNRVVYRIGDTMTELLDVKAARTAQIRCQNIANGENSCCNVIGVGTQNACFFAYNHLNEAVYRALVLNTTEAATPTMDYALRLLDYDGSSTKYYTVLHNGNANLHAGHILLGSAVVSTSSTSGVLVTFDLSKLNLSDYREFVLQGIYKTTTTSSSYHTSFRFRTASDAATTTSLEHSFVKEAVGGSALSVSGSASANAVTIGDAVNNYLGSLSVRFRAVENSTVTGATGKKYLVGESSCCVNFAPSTKTVRNTFAVDISAGVAYLDVFRDNNSGMVNGTQLYLYGVK